MKKIILIVSILLLSSLEMFASSLRVQTKELLNNPTQYKILDTRSTQEYKKGHIQNAINFPVSSTYAHKKRDGKLTDPFSMQKIVQGLGLNADDKIVVYDDGSFFDAARLFWALEVYGFKDIKLLNAGYKQWQTDGYAVSTQTPKTTQSDYITIIDNNRLATKFATQVATRNPNQLIIDARPDQAYEGKVSSASRYGHIPKAINIPASHNIDTDNTASQLKDLDDLADIYKDIPKGKKVIIYCAIGKISATNYFALRELGYNVSNYDASWKEWGNDLRLPVVNPSK